MGNSASIKKTDSRESLTEEDLEILEIGLEGSEVSKEGAELLMGLNLLPHENEPLDEPAIDEQEVTNKIGPLSAHTTLGQRRER